MRAVIGAAKARRAIELCENVVAIELLAAAQGIEFHHPKKSSGTLEQVISEIRDVSDRYVQDRSLAVDISTLAHLVDEGYFYSFAAAILPSGAT